MSKSEESKNKIAGFQEQIDDGNVDKVIEELDRYLQANCENKDTLLYLRGNAYRKKQNWQEAMNNYQQAIDINPDSPAVHAREMLIN
ncbi:MAG: tetratricopeptide repeat protein, partial [Bacteroidaceae bacterium]|nr:tetratricopeptide repeat protein [Bacteroidaceae bacterium]